MAFATAFRLRRNPYWRSLAGMAFGDCCSELREAMNGRFNALIQPFDGTLFMTVGWIETEDGVGWFDSAVLFCPFCGTRLQTKKEVKKRGDERRPPG